MSGCEWVGIRGNVPTRIAQVGKTCDAVILAMAGLQRLASQAHYFPLDINDFVPAAGQGVMGAVCRKDSEFLPFLQKISDQKVQECVHLEREVIRGLGAHCHSPVGVYVHSQQQIWHVLVFIGHEQGGLQHQKSYHCTPMNSALVLNDLEQLGAFTLLPR